MLKSLFSKIALRKFAGLYVGDHELTLSQVAVTPLGTVEVACRSVGYTTETLIAVLRELLQPLIPKRGTPQTPLAVGLSPMRLFFTTRPIQVTDRDASASVLLHEVLRSTNVNVDEMQVDMLRSQPGKRPVASLIACRKKYLATVLGAVARCELRPYRAEPGPFALLRLGRQRYREPRKARSVVRVFVGPAHGLALLTSSGTTLGWRTFELPAGDEAKELVSAFMSLQVVGRHCGETEPPDVVMIHGRPDLAEAFEAEPFQKALGVAVQHHPGPSFEPASVALGLALGCRQADVAYDLARTLKPRPPLREVLPWGMVAAQALVLGGLTYLIDDQCHAVREAFRAVRAESVQHTWLAKTSDQDLDKEKKQLEQKIAAVREYLETRVLWSPLTRDAAARLPDAIFLRSFSGACELEMGPKKMGGAKKSMTVKLSAPIPKGQAMPREVDELLSALRSDAILQKDFPVVEVADLKWFQPVAGATTAQAEFTVNCLPRIEKPAAKKPPGEAQPGH